MTDVLLNCLLILVFIVIGGVFATAEMSLVSLRESQIRSLASRGGRGRTVAKLTSDPNRFLSAVQVGVTVSGFLSAAFGAATLSDHLAPIIALLGIPLNVSRTIALVLITIVISFFSIVLGELTAKRLALQRSEAFALALAPLVDLIATLARPVIWLLGVSTNIAVRLLGGDPQAAREEVSDEEIRAMVSESTTLGDEERRILDDVFAAGERTLREVMVPRTEVDFLAASQTVHQVLTDIRDAPHSRYPVRARSADDVIGFIHVRDLFLPATPRDATLRQLVRPVLSLPGTVHVLHALSLMRANAAHLAVVVDEYGGTAGIVTMEDLVEELVGDISDEYDKAPDVAVSLAPDERELDGLLGRDEFTELTGQELPEGHFDTIAGFVMAELGEVPTEGASIEVELTAETDEDEASRWRFVVTELDGRRAARLRMSRVHEDAEPAQEGASAEAS